MLWVCLFNLLLLVKSETFLNEYSKFLQRQSAHRSESVERMINSLAYSVIYTSNPQVPLESRILGFSAAMIYAMLTDRQLYITNDALDDDLFKIASFVIPLSNWQLQALRPNSAVFYGPKPRENIGWIDTSGVDTLTWFGCSSPWNDKRLKVVVLDRPDYYIPLLFLNKHYSERLKRLFPNNSVFSEVFQAILAWDKDHEQLSKATLVFSEEKYDHSIDVNARKCLSDQENLFILADRNDQHVKYFAQKSNFHLVSLPKASKHATWSDRNRLNDIITASSNTTLIIQHGESALGEVISSIARNPMVQVSSGQCSICCRTPSKSWEPCFGGASLKAYQNVCFGASLLDDDDGFKRPDHVDSCKLRRIGIQVLTTNDSQ